MANLLVRFAGKVCEVLLPIKHDIFFGNENSSIGVCTLSSIDLLEEVSKSEMMNDVALAARLFSENKGIEKLIEYVLQHPTVKYVVLCGNDTKGHLPGQALLALYKNGIDSSGRIIGAVGKEPVIEAVTKNNVEAFRKRAKIIDLVGVTDIEKISDKVSNLVRT
ncbi:MAG: tetrahydromethanopterin S-methyltransferase subunit A [Candidatus Nitrosomirales archaeon]|jgi:tetrahydromethanopterin S-methyltransferase subunit A